MHYRVKPSSNLWSRHRSRSRRRRKHSVNISEVSEARVKYETSNFFVQRVTWLCVIFWDHYEIGKTTTHMLQQHHSIVTSWQYQPTFARQKSTLWIRLAMKIKFWHTWKLLWLTPGAQGEHLAHQPGFTAFTGIYPAYLVDELALVFYTPLC